MEKITVLYNDNCSVCSLEINHYKAMCSKRNLPIAFEKISDQGSVLIESQLSIEDAKKRLHVRAADGTLHIGVDAFLVIWATLPYYRWLGGAVSIPGIYTFVDLIYNYVLAPLLYRWDQGRVKKNSSR